MTEENFIFEAGDRVKFDGFEHPFKGKVLAPVKGLPNAYYVQSQAGEIKTFVGKALERLEGK